MHLTIFLGSLTALVPKVGAKDLFILLFIYFAFLLMFHYKH